jgi:hypothetical protein
MKLYNNLGQVPLQHLMHILTGLDNLDMLTLFQQTHFESQGSL